MNHLEIKKSIESLEQETNTLNGKLSLLNQQLEDSVIKQKDLCSAQILNSKAIELLHLVKKITQEKVKEMFEKVITEALCYIHQSNDYSFELAFSRRGAIPSLDFNVKTPGMQEAHNILDCRGGGTCDIVSLALRFVLLEISKTQGFLFMDEPFKHLDSPETINKAIDFVKELQQKTNRQIFLITHKSEVVESVSNPIIISKNNEKKPTIKIDKVKPKKRRRPKKCFKKLKP